jgi:hypothetical protein
MAKIFRGPAINTPNPRVSLGRFLFDRLKPHGDQVAIVSTIYLYMLKFNFLYIFF